MQIDSRKAFLAKAACIAAIILVRVIYLNSDPPPWLSWSSGLYTDEGFYTLDARSEALFGHLASGNFHDRLLSPLLSLLQQYWFALFGTNLVVARLLSVAFSLLTLLVFYFALRHLCGQRIAEWGTLFLGLMPPMVFYNRLALQETPTLFFLVLAMYFWACDEQQPKTNKQYIFALLCGLTLGMSIIFKPLSILAAPAFLISNGPQNWRKLLARSIAFIVILGLYGLLWYLPHHEQLSRMALYYRQNQMEPHSLAEFLLNIERGLFSSQKGLLPYLLRFAPVPILCCFIKNKERDRAKVFFLLWLSLGLVFCLCSSYAPSRYYLLFLPALAALGAIGLAKVPPKFHPTILLFFFLTSGGWIITGFIQRTYYRSAISHTLATELRYGSMLVGELAPELAWDTPFAAAPVQPSLSNSQNPVQALHATEIITTDSAYWKTWWKSQYPDIIQQTHLRNSFSTNWPSHRTIQIYSVAMKENKRNEAK